MGIPAPTGGRPLHAAIAVKSQLILLFLNEKSCYWRLPLQEMQAVPPLGAAPTTGAICVGHFSSFDVNVGGARDPTLSSEVAFHAAHVIEGIHVVPNKIMPPGFNIEGRTFPDLHTRPFTLVVTARDVDRPHQLVNILSLNVSGGCQWIPIMPPFNAIAIDHLIFNGDFDVATVILHGMKIDTQMLTPEAQRVVQMGFSHNGTNTLAIGMDGNSLRQPPVPVAPVEEENLTWWDADSDPLASDLPDTCSLVIPHSILSSLQGLVEAYTLQGALRHKKLLTMSGTSGSPGSLTMGVPAVIGCPPTLMKGLGQGDPRRANCTVSLVYVAELVGFIFSPEAEVLSGEVSLATIQTLPWSARLTAIDATTRLMHACYTSAGDPVNTHKSALTHEEFNVALGEEAAGTTQNPVCNPTLSHNPTHPTNHPLDATHTLHQHRLISHSLYKTIFVTYPFDTPSINTRV